MAKRGFYIIANSN